LLAIAVNGIFNAQLYLAHETLFVTRIMICVDLSIITESSNPFSTSIFHLFTNSFHFTSSPSKFNSIRFFFSFCASGFCSTGLVSGNSTFLISHVDSLTAHVESLTSHDKTISHVDVQ
jgi:hypothetical protein